MIEVLKNIFGFRRKKTFFQKWFYIFKVGRKQLQLREFLVNALDTGIYIVSVASPLSTLPQIWLLFSSKDTAGLSLITWGAYLVLTFFWLAYGYIHKEKPIIFSQILWGVIYGLAVIGIILYS